MQNIDGDTPAHILFGEINGMVDFDLYLNLVQRTNLNIQNNMGYSIFFYIIKKSEYEKFRKIFEKEKLNVFIFNNKKQNVFDFIKKDNLEDFIKMVATSYLNNIDKNKTYYDYWDNKCRVKKNDFTKNEKKELISYGVNLKSKNICYDIIYYKLQKNIDYFIKNRTVLPEMFSYPKKFIYPEFIVGYKNVSVSTYTSSAINIFFGLLYLNINFSFVASSLNIMSKTNIIYNTETFCDVKNFQLLWKNFQLINPFDNISEKIGKFIDEKYNFFILPIGIEIFMKGEIHGHSNILIFDFINKEYERFEPYGQEPYFFKYDTILLDSVIENLFKSLNFKYITSSKFMPKIGIQTYEINEVGIYIGDPEGYCSAWCLFWVYNRIKHNKIPRHKLFNAILKEIINKNISYKSLIRFFCQNITDLRDKYFNNIGININEWTNDSLTKDNISKLNKILEIELNLFD